jgi:hypothetical protein
MVGSTASEAVGILSPSNTNTVEVRNYYPLGLPHAGVGAFRISGCLGDLHHKG